MNSFSEKRPGQIFLRNGFLNSGENSGLETMLKPFGLERVNKTPRDLGLNTQLLPKPIMSLKTREVYDRRATSRSLIDISLMSCMFMTIALCYQEK